MLPYKELPEIPRFHILITQLEHHAEKNSFRFFFGRDFAFGVYTQLCKSFENISVYLKGVQRCLFNIFLSNRSQVERMLWELNKRIINIVIVHEMLKRHIFPCEVLILSAISVWINPEIYHLIQGIKNKNKTKLWLSPSLKIQILFISCCH